MAQKRYISSKSLLAAKIAPDLLVPKTDYNISRARIDTSNVPCCITKNNDCKSVLFD